MLSAAEAADPEKRLARLERCHLRNGLESKLKPSDSGSDVRTHSCQSIFSFWSPVLFALCGKGCDLGAILKLTPRSVQKEQGGVARKVPAAGAPSFHFNFVLDTEDVMTWRTKRFTPPERRHAIREARATKFRHWHAARWAQIAAAAQAAAAAAPQQLLTPQGISALHREALLGGMHRLV